MNDLKIWRDVDPYGSQRYEYERRAKLRVSAEVYRKPGGKWAIVIDRWVDDDLHCISDGRYRTLTEAKAVAERFCTDQGHEAAHAKGICNVY